MRSEVNDTPRTELVPNIQSRIDGVIFVARLQEVDNDKSCVL